MTADLAELLARVEAAEGPDQELDTRILATLLSDQPIAAVEKSPINGMWCAYVEGYGGKRRLWETPSPFRQMSGITASIDAILALAERLLPGCRVMVERDHSGEGWAMVRPAPPGAAERSMIDGKTPALAAVAALLTALITQAEAPQSSEAPPLGCAGEAELSTPPGMNQEDGPA